MEDNVMFAKRFGIAFYFYGISKQQKENIKEAFYKFLNIIPYKFEYYSSIGNLKKLKDNVKAIEKINNYLDNYINFNEDVVNIEFTDANISQMSNIYFNVHLTDDTEIQFPSYLYCEFPLKDFVNVKTYAIEIFKLLHCQYTCGNHVIAYNPHISKSFTKAMRYLEKTKTYSNRFSIYKNPNFIRHILAKNRKITFEGVDGINFIQLYSLDWFNKIKSDFVDVAVNKGLLKLEQTKQYALTQLPYNDFVYDEDEQLVSYYKELYNIYKPIIINFDKPVGFWKKDNWHAWRNRFYDIPMEPEPKRLENMKKLLKIFDNPQNKPTSIETEIIEKEITIGEFLKANSLKNELISSEKAWDRYQELYNENNDIIPVIIDGGYDLVITNLNENIHQKITDSNETAFDETLLEEYQDEFDDTVNNLIRRNLDDDVNFENETVLIVKLNVNYPYEILKIIPFGGFNDCPNPQKHYEVAKRWYEKYKVVPIIIGKDFIQYYMKETIINKDMLRQIVCEQCCYCTPEEQTVKELANTTYSSKFWYFWWD